MTSSTTTTTKLPAPFDVKQPSESDLKVGNTFTLDYTANEDIDTSTIRFYSTDEKVLIVTNDGKVTVIAEGKAEIIVNAKSKAGDIFLDSMNLTIKGSVFLTGDVTQDGIINGSDAALALRAYTMINSGGESSLSSTQEKAADVNGDGMITASDATIILRYYTLISSGTASGNAPTIEEWLKNQ